MKKLIEMAVLCLVILISGLNEAWSQQRTTVIESGKGQWCSWCPRSTVRAREFKQLYGNQVIIIGVHVNDLLSVPGYGSSMSLSNFPSGNIDRIFTDFDPMNWDMVIGSALANTPFASVNIDNWSFDSTSRNLNMTISAQFNSQFAGDYRFCAVLIEDGFMGDNFGFNQTNAYAGSAYGPMGGFENYPNPVSYKDMVYDDVARALILGYNGMSGSLPNTIMPNTPYTYTYNYTVPSGIDWKKSKVAVFVVEPNPRYIMNAALSPYLNGDTNAIPFARNSLDTTINLNDPFSYTIKYHDSDADPISVSKSGTWPTWVNFQDNGDETITISSNDALSAGVFNLNLAITDQVENIVQTFKLTVVDPLSIKTIYDKVIGIYHNSHENQLLIDNNGIKIEAHLQVRDLQGRSIINTYLNDQKSISTSDWPKGIYIAEIKGRDWRKVRKIAIQ